MAEIICEPKNLISSETCADRGGWYIGFYAKYSEIDWADMASDALFFDQTNQEILGFTMVGGATWKKIEPRKRGATYNFNYTSATGFYECNAACIFDSKDRDRRNNLQYAIQCCDLVVVLFGNNGKKRVIGVDWNGVEFSRPVDNFRISQHNDQGGDLGTSTSTDDLAWQGNQLFAPLFADVARSIFPS